MTEHKAGTREEFEAASKKLGEREQQLNKLGQEIAQERRELPWVPIEKEYTFETEEGTKTLVDLFDGRSQLLVYHIMFGPDWTGACPACSALADNFDGTLAHLNARDVTFICVSHAPIEKIASYKRRMGWQFPWLSSYRSDFNYDFGGSFTEEQRAEFADQVLEQFAGNDEVAEMAASTGTDLAGYVTTEGPGMSAFVLDDGVVYQTYFDRENLERVMLFDRLLDYTPKGGKEGVVIHRHDEYPAAVAASR